MTAAYRLKGIGWFAGCVAIVLGFYLISLQVASERKKLDGINDRIHAAERDIRALETEFDTRANLAQLEKWNGDTLALASPTAGQFVASEAALASIDVNQVAAPGQPGVQTAALVVPSLPSTAPSDLPAAQASTPQIVQVAAAMPLARPAVIKVAAVEKSAPLMAKLDDAARGRAAVAKVRPQAVCSRRSAGPFATSARSSSAATRRTSKVPRTTTATPGPQRWATPGRSCDMRRKRTARRLPRSSPNVRTPTASSRRSSGRSTSTGRSSTP